MKQTNTQIVFSPQEKDSGSSSSSSSSSAVSTVLIKDFEGLEASDSATKEAVVSFW